MTDFTYTEDAKDYEKDDLEEMPITVVGDLEQYQFPRSEGVHCLEVRHNSDTYRLDAERERTESVTVATRAQKKLLQSVLMLKLLLISYVHPIRFDATDMKETLASIENRTPPIGEPNATATPAALAAVIISRIFPESTNQRGFVHKQNKQRNIAYLGYVKTA